MSAKNKLQEYYQKRGEDLPKYETKRLGGDDHNPTWLSYLCLPGGKKFARMSNGKKKDIEMLIAEDALQALKMSKGMSLYTFNIPTSKRLAILVDIENCPKVLTQFKDVASVNIDLFGFLSEKHCLVRRYKNISDSRLNVVYVPTGRQDGADIALTLAAGAILQANLYRSYIIISGDHFAAALADCIKGYSRIASCHDSMKTPIVNFVGVCRSFDNCIGLIQEIINS